MTARPAAASAPRPLSQILTSAYECPAWCTRTDVHTVHVRQAGRTGRVWVATVHEDAWIGTQVMVAHTAAAGGPSSSVMFPPSSAADLAEIFRQLGNADVAALIDDAIAAATTEAHP